MIDNCLKICYCCRYAVSVTRRILSQEVAWIKLARSVWHLIEEEKLFKVIHVIIIIDVIINHGSASPAAPSKAKLLLSQKLFLNLQER